MGTNKDVTIPLPWQVVGEVIQILVSIAYTLVSLGLSLGLAASSYKRYLINDCLVNSNMHTPPVDLSVVSFISTFIATFMVLGIIYYEVIKSDVFVKIYVGIYGAYLVFVLFLVLEIYR